MSRMDDAAIREAMAGAALRSCCQHPESEPIAAEALARGEELREAQDNVTALAAVAIDGAHAGVTPTGLVARQGIDAITALRAEVERLTRERDEAKGNAERYAADIVRVMAQRDEARSRILADEERLKLTGDALSAEAEVARLRAEAIPEDAEERVAEALYLRQCARSGLTAISIILWHELNEAVRNHWRVEAIALLAAIRRQA